MMFSSVPLDPMQEKSSQPGIVDDFMYGSNVAGSHIYIRMGFLRKVYGILTTQLLVTMAVGALYIMVDPIKTFVQTNHWMLIVGLILNLGLVFALMIKRNETPTNYILLGVFTLAEAHLVGTIITFYDKIVVLEALGLTLAVTLGLTLYTFQSKRDFSQWGAGLMSVLWVFILAGFMQFFFRSPMMEFGIAVAGAVIFSLFIIFDTHMMMHKLSPEDYIVAAVNLYLDIINLFLYILRILQSSRE